MQFKGLHEQNLSDAVRAMEDTGQQVQEFTTTGFRSADSRHRSPFGSIDGGGAVYHTLSVALADLKAG